MQKAQGAKRKATRPNRFRLAPSAFRVRRRAVRWAFHHFYREFAWSYDAVAWLVSAGLWQRWAQAAIPELCGRVLELGFGPGHVQLALADRPQVAGIDASPNMVALAGNRLRRRGFRPRLARAVAQALPFADAAFDTVLATFPADYILAEETHAELLRVLAPQGRLVVVPFAQLEDGLYTRLVGLLYQLTFQQPPTARAARPQLEWLHVRSLSFEQRWVRVDGSAVLILIGSRKDHGARD